VPWKSSSYAMALSCQSNGGRCIEEWWVPERWQWDGFRDMDRGFVSTNKILSIWPNDFDLSMQVNAASAAVGAMDSHQGRS